MKTARDIQRGMLDALVGRGKPLPSYAKIMDTVRQAFTEFRECQHNARRSQATRRARIRKLAGKATNGLVAHGLVSGRQPQLTATVPLGLLATLLHEWATLSETA